jgi:hypothetical protein
VKHTKKKASARVADDEDPLPAQCVNAVRGPRGIGWHTWVCERRKLPSPPVGRGWRIIASHPFSLEREAIEKILMLGLSWAIVTMKGASTRASWSATKVRRHILEARLTHILVARCTRVSATRHRGVQQPARKDGQRRCRSQAWLDVLGAHRRSILQSASISTFLQECTLSV